MAEVDEVEALVNIFPFYQLSTRRLARKKDENIHSFSVFNIPWTSSSSIVMVKDLPGTLSVLRV